MTRAFLTLCLAAGLFACDGDATAPVPDAGTGDAITDVADGDVVVEDVATPPDDADDQDATADTTTPEDDATAEDTGAAEEVADDATGGDVAEPTVDVSPPDTAPPEDTPEPADTTPDPGPADAAVIDDDATTNITCDPSKMDFTQANAPAYEFYELCIDKGAPAEVQDALIAIDASLYCGVSGVFAGCSGSVHIGCHGDLEFVGATKTITDGKWAQLCALSVQDVVQIIGGGHWVN